MVLRLASFQPSKATRTLATTTAPCSVSFLTTFSHTARPLPLPKSDGMSDSRKLWIVIGVAILLTIIIPVLVLWIRWKLSAPRRSGKRSVSIELEKSGVPKSSKASGSKKVPSLPNAEGSVNGSGGPSPGNIKIVNNIHIHKRRPSQQQPTASPNRRTDDLPPRSPRVELEARPLNHRARLPENQPWMHQDQNGRWVPREEGWLYPGLPPPLHLRNGRGNVGSGDQEGDARGERRYIIPGAWRH